MSGHGIREAAMALPRSKALAIPRHRGLQGVGMGWLFVLLFVAAYLLLPLSAAHSATYYVATNGNDNAAGSSNAPWRTIMHAVKTVVAGDVVILRDGTYNEMVALDALQMGSSPITFQAENARKAIIDPQGSSYCFGADWNTMQNIRLVGLKLQNGKMGLGFNVGGNGMTFINCEISGGLEGIRVRDGSNLTIQDCYVHDNANGVLLGTKGVSGVQNVLIERTVSSNNCGAGQTGNTDGFAIEGMCTNLVIRDCVSNGAGDSGFDIKPSDSLLERCVAFNNVGMGFKLWGNNVTLANCIAYSNKTDGIATAGDNLRFWGCTIANNASNGIRLETMNAPTCVVKDCILYNNPIQTYSSNLFEDNYNSYYSASNAYVVRTASTTYNMAQVNGHNVGLGAFSFGGNPAFVSPSSADFRLLAGSPCIGTGVADATVALDFYAKTRLNPPDMGAIAYNTGTSTDPVIPTAPTLVSITAGVTAPTTNDLVAVASGSTASNGVTVSYQYQWQYSTDGKTWSAWLYNGNILPANNLVAGQMWKARARASVDETNYSAWVSSAVCTISAPIVQTPAAPTAVTISPATPSAGQTLTATATGGGLANTATAYVYQWSKSTDGANWTAWGLDGAVLSTRVQAGELWKARASAVCNGVSSAWTESGIVSVPVPTPTPAAPTAVTISPATPSAGQTLTATATGGGLANTATTYVYQWSKSTDGANWTAWGLDGAVLSTRVQAGELWKARASAVCNGVSSAWTESGTVTVPVPPVKLTVPTSVKINPSAPNVTQALSATALPAVGNGVSYIYQWQKKPAFSRFWSAWNWQGQTLAASNLTVGDSWRCRVAATNGTTTSAWKVSAAVTIAKAPPSSTTGSNTVTITPTNPVAGQTLTAKANWVSPTGGHLDYEYYWSVSYDGGKTWKGWNYYGVTLPMTTHTGEWWRAEGRSHDGRTWGPFVISAPVAIR